MSQLQEKRNAIVARFNDGPEPPESIKSLLRIVSASESFYRELLIQSFTTSILPELYCMQHSLRRPVPAVKDEFIKPCLIPIGNRNGFIAVGIVSTAAYLPVNVNAQKTTTADIYRNPQYASVRYLYKNFLH